ncbi:MAG: T9SS type A sorting domain-containing protein [Saprospiraceae bacterium]|nr:T9SS type A sorting domain-containing protein [Saprospiraceae bacterium]
MKKLSTPFVIISLLCLFSSVAIAQQAYNFSSSPNLTIPYCPTVTNANIIIPANTIPVSAGALAYRLTQVTVNINHSRTSDLDIYLRGPGNVLVELSTDNGGNGANYSNTTFVFNNILAPNGSISTGFAPFTGTYLPEGNPNTVFSTLNGTWKLEVCDDAVGVDDGVLLSWSISFGPVSSCNIPLATSTCDFQLNWNSGGAGNHANYNTYAAMPGICILNNPGNADYNGDDVWFNLTVSGSTLLTINLYNLDADLDLFVFKTNSCSTFSDFCFSRNDGPNHEEISGLFSTGSYRIVVDGKFAGIAGAFTLSVTTQSNSCNICGAPNVSCYESTIDPALGPVLQCDDFESYALGGITNQSPLWEKWINNATDPAIVNNPSGVGKVLKFEKPNPQSSLIDKVNAMYLFKNRTQGRFRLSWLMYVPTGKRAYYAVQHTQMGSELANLAYQVNFINGVGSMNIRNESLNMPAAQFTFQHNTWIEVMQIIDLEANKAELWINSEFIYSWPFNVGSNGNLLQLGAVHFRDFDINSLFYIDKLCLRKADCTGIPCNLDPNPKCIKNGDTYDSECAARCAGYTMDEWETCTDCNSSSCAEAATIFPNASLVKCDNLNSYTAGQGVAAQTARWRKRIPSSDDATVVNDVFLGGKMLKLEQNGAIDPDVLFQLGNQTQGRYRLSWNMYIPAGKQAFFSINHSQQNITPTNRAYQVRFEANGTGHLRIGAENFDRAGFPFAFNSWNEIMQIIDISANKFELWINGEFVYSWNNFDDGSSGISSQLASINFYANTNHLFYVDNICLWKINCGSVICQGEEPICMKNGLFAQINCAEEALCLGYTPREWEYCNSVCDVGGTFIYRGDTFMGTLELTDAPPPLLTTVPEVIAAFGGSLPNPLLSKIYVFDNEPGGTIDIELPILPNGAKGFVFRCVCGTESNPDGCDQVYVGPADSTYVNAPGGFYYIAIMGSTTGSFGIAVFPTNACATNPNQLFCGDFVVGATDPNNTMSVANDNYSLCYNGVRAYEGGESFQNFRLEVPTTINIEVTSQQPIGVFLFSYLCGQTCLVYAENDPPNDSTVAILDYPLPVGEYYIVIDTEADPQNRESNSPPETGFSLLYYEGACGISLPFVVPISGTYTLTSGSSCPSDTMADHSVIIKSNAFNFQTTDMLSFYYVDEFDDLSTNFLMNRFWNGQNEMLMELPKDVEDGAPKCSYIEGDSLQIFLTHTGSGTMNFRKMIPNYAPIGQENANANRLYVSEGLSIITGLEETNQVISFLVNPIQLAPPATALTLPISLQTNKPWEIIIPPTAPWIRRTTATPALSTGSRTLNFELDPNPEREPRTVEILIRTRNTSPEFQQAVTITQAGICLTPEATVEADAGGICPGDSLQLTAVFDTTLQDLFTFRWNTGDTTASIRVAPTPLDTFYVIVTDRYCLAKGTFFADINLLPAPAQPVNTSPASYCSSNALPQLSVTVVGNTTVDWFDSPDTGLSLATGLNFTPDSAGTYYAQARSLNAQGCINPLRTEITLIADPSAEVTIAPVTGTCVNSLVALSAAIGGAATTANWTASVPGGNFSNANILNPTYTPPLNFTGTIQLFLTTNDPGGACPAARDTAVLQVDATTEAEAGDDATICSGTTLTLNGQIGGAASSATWTASVPGGQFTPNANTLAAVYTPPPGFSDDIVLTLTTNDPAGPCPLATDALTLTVIAAASAEAGSVASICQGGTAALSGNFGGTATSASWSAPVGTFANPNQLNTTFTPPANFSGEIILTLTTNDPPGFCPPATDVVTLVVQPRATADAGQDVLTCTGSEVTLNGQVGGSASSGTWSTTAGGIFSPNNTTPNATYTPPPGTSGGIQLTWTTNNPDGPCNSATDAVNLFFGELPTVEAGAGQSVCGSGSILLNGTIGGGAVSQVSWNASVNGGQFTPPDGSGETVSYTPPPGFSGNIIFTLTAVSAFSNCPPVSDFLVVTVSQPATVDAGAGAAICAGASANVSGSIGGSATSATWSAPVGVFANANNLNTTYTAPPGFSGPVTLTLTTNDPPGICPAAQDAITITVNPPVEVDAGTYPTVCPGTPIELTAIPSGGSGAYQFEWSNDLGGTASVDVIANFSTTYSVTATDANGCTATDQAAVNVHFPIFLTVAPESAAVCTGSSVNLLAVAVGGSGTIDLVWSDGQTGPNIMVTPSTSVNLIVTATDENNCQVRDTVPITLHPAINVVTPPDPQACAGQLVPLIAIANGGSGTINYNWDNGLGAGQSHTVTLFNTTTFNVTATDANNCSATNDVTVIITQPPVASASLDQDSICAGQSVNLSSSSNQSVTSVFWTPSVSGGSFNPGNNSSNTAYTPPPGFLGQITMELRTNALGPCPAFVDLETIQVFPAPSFVVQELDCSPSLDTYSIEFQSDALAVSSPQGPVLSLGAQIYRLEGIAAGTAVVITTEGANCAVEHPVNAPDCSCLQQGIQIPQPTSTGDVVVCEDEAVPTLTVNISPDFDVNWFASATGNDTVAINTLEFAATESGTYFAEAVDPVSGCVSAVRTPVSLTIKDNPVADAGENQVVCTGETTSLQAFTDDFYTYEWSTGETSDQIEVVATSSALYFLTVTLDGCTSTDSVLVGIHPLIVADITLDNPVLCHNDATGALSVDITGGDPDFLVVWSTGDTAVALTGLSAGDYSATITDGNGCEITLSESLLNPPLLVLNDTTVTDADINQSNGAIDVDISGGTPPLQFFWTRVEDGVTFDTEDISGLQPGLYALEVTDANQCILQDTFLVDMITGTFIAGLEAEIRIFPNPTRDKLYISLQQSASAEVDVELLDMLGRPLLYRSEQVGLQAVIQLDLEALPTGMYTVKIAVGNAIITQKVTKQ